MRTIETAEWITGLNMDIFKEELNLITTGGQVEAKFDITIATDSQKENFVSECIKAYQRTIVGPQAAQLCIPTYKLKATEWKKAAEKLDGKNGHPKIKWRAAAQAAEQVVE